MCVVLKSLSADPERRDGARAVLPLDALLRLSTRLENIVMFCGLGPNRQPVKRDGETVRR